VGGMVGALVVGALVVGALVGDLTPVDSTSPHKNGGAKLCNLPRQALDPVHFKSTASSLPLQEEISISSQA